jgi:hypothetical protein
MQTDFYVKKHWEKPNMPGDIDPLQSSQRHSAALARIVVLKDRPGLCGVLEGRRKHPPAELREKSPGH